MNKNYSDDTNSLDEDNDNKIDTENGEEMYKKYKEEKEKEEQKKKDDKEKEEKYKKEKEEKEKNDKDKKDRDEWFERWNSIANSTDPNLITSSNYVPKTQIIPPLCQNCPMLSGTNAGVCTSCGGLGGNGTSSKYKNRFSDFLSTYGSGYKGQGAWAGIGGSGRDDSDPSLSRLAEKTGEGVFDLTKTALNNATGLAYGAGSGAVGLARDTGSGAVGLVRDTGSGAVGLVRDTGSGAAGLLRDTGSGAAGLLKSNPMQVGSPYANAGYGYGNQGYGYIGYGNNPYQSGYYSQGTYSIPNNPIGMQGIDPYSYNGALVSKGGNYIPVTDDFSSFRK